MIFILLLHEYLATIRVFMIVPNINEKSLETLFSELLVCNSTARKIALDKIAIENQALRMELEVLLRASDQANGFLSVSPVLPMAELESNESTPLIDKNIGSYQLIEELGRGGMGIVYHAERADGEFSKQVAIKLLNHAISNEKVLNRFRAERQILADLEHPNIAHLLDGGTLENGCPYLVMEYVEGEPIDSYCRSRQLSIKERLQLFIKVCTAVQFAHDNFIVHRDLKPDNILITKKGEPKLLDFGIAKRLKPEHVADDGSPPNILGIQTMTPDYASPEQIMGGDITTATDIYSLGTVLYELLTGHRPYDLSADYIINVQTFFERPIPLPSCHRPEIQAELSGNLDNIILFSLQIQPELRYLSVQHLSEDLKKYLAG